jgi:hypothetical protein
MLNNVPRSGYYYLIHLNPERPLVTYGINAERAVMRFLPAMPIIVRIGAAAKPFFHSAQFLFWPFFPIEG